MNFALRAILLLVCFSGASFGAVEPPKPLSDADAEAALKILREKYVDPGAVKDAGTTGAAVAKFLGELRGGVELASSPATTPAAVPLFNANISDRFGYILPGTLNLENLRALEKIDLAKIDTLVLDLRASSGTNDFEIAAQFAQLFVRRGKTVWTIHQPSTHQDQTVTSERDPLFSGPLLILIDEETRGGAEALAAALKARGHSLLIGGVTAGGAVRLSDFPLPSGATLRVATAEVAGPNGRIFPLGVSPDLPVTFPPAQKAKAFAAAKMHGLSAVIAEEERPHFNEAALLAGNNPEPESRSARPEETVHDAVLQRAVDVAISLTIFARR